MYVLKEPNVGSGAGKRLYEYACVCFYSPFRFRQVHDYDFEAIGYRKMVYAYYFRIEFKP